MSEVKIYRGTMIGGESIVVFRTGTWHDDEMCYRNVFTQEGYKESRFTDLTELELHPKGEGVWIEGVSAEELLDLLAKSQLSDMPKATEEQVSLGEDDECCIRCSTLEKSVGCPCNCHDTKPIPPSVTVKGEHARRDLMQFLTLAKDHVKEQGYGLILEERIDGYFAQLVSYFTPPVELPEPSEPEVGSFALLKNGSVTKRGELSEFGSSGDNQKSWFATDEHYYLWPEIYPHIIRLYTPSGELVTGFEYAGGDK